MSKVSTYLRSEPALLATVLNIGIAQAAAHGFNLSTDTVANVYSLASIVLGVGVRQQVTPTIKP